MSVWLVLHIFGAILLVGNIVTAAFWKVRADLEGKPEVMHSAAKGVMKADYFFTLPGLVLVVGSGVAMAAASSYVLTKINWLTLSILLFAVTGLVWGLILLPLQRRMIRGSEEAVRTGVVPAAYHRASRQWAVFGTLATLLPVIILYLMVAKP